MLLFESLGLYHSISIEQPLRLSLPSPGGVPLNGLRAQVGFGDNKDNLFRYTNIPNSNLSIPYVLLLVAGLGFGNGANFPTLKNYAQTTTLSE